MSAVEISTVPSMRPVAWARGGAGGGRANGRRWDAVKRGRQRQHRGHGRDRGPRQRKRSPALRCFGWDHGHAGGWIIGARVHAGDRDDGGKDSLAT